MEWLILPWIKNYEIEFRSVYITERRKQRKLGMYMIRRISDHTRAVCYLQTDWQKWRAMSSPSAPTKYPLDFSWSIGRDIYSPSYIFRCFNKRNEILNTRCLIKVSDVTLPANPLRFVFPSDCLLSNRNEISVFKITTL